MSVTPGYDAVGSQRAAAPVHAQGRWPSWLLLRRCCATVQRCTLVLHNGNGLIRSAKRRGKGDRGRDSGQHAHGHAATTELHAVARENAQLQDGVVGDVVCIGARYQGATRIQISVTLHTVRLVSVEAASGGKASLHDAQVQVVAVRGIAHSQRHLHGRRVVHIATLGAVPPGLRARDTGGTVGEAAVGPDI